MMRFRLPLSLVLAVAGLLFLMPPVHAASCTVGTFIGTCKDACTADEVTGLQVQMATKAKLDADTTCTQTCCILKGSALCSWAASDAKVEGGECGNPCTGLAMTSKGYPEFCPGGTTCCAKMPGETKTLSGSGATAPASGGGSPVTLTNPLGPNASFYIIIRNVIQAFLGMVGGLALLVFVYAGVLWMTAGSSDRVQKAKDTMKYAVIGLAMIAFSYVITSFVVDALMGKVETPAAPVEVEYATPGDPNP
ncbi:MAG: pilin [Patescibacteria group bacterium]